MEHNILKDALTGMLVGDMLGTFIAENNKPSIKQNIAIDIQDDSSCWSLDTSLAICLTEILSYNLDKEVSAQLLSQFVKGQYWAQVQDIDFLNKKVKEQLTRAASGHHKIQFSRSTEVDDNITLLHVIPAAFYLVNMPVNMRFTLLTQIVSITSTSTKALLASLYIEEFLRSLMRGESIMSSYHTVREVLPIIWRNMNMDINELSYLWRLLETDIWQVTGDKIHATEDIIDTLEACIWVITTTDSFVQALTKAVSLGGDTSSLGALVGAMAGIIYSLDNIPRDWAEKIHLLDQVHQLAEKAFELSL